MLNYRIAEPGPCLEGECTSNSCPTFGKMGVLNEGFNDYDLARGATKRCSQSYDDAIPTTPAR